MQHNIKRMRTDQWNRMLHTYSRKDKIYNAPSLYDMCKLKTRETYRSNWGEVTCLPQTIQKDLLKDWLHCDEIMPLSSDEESQITDIIDLQSPYHITRNRPMTVECFIALMNHPFEVPNFCDITCHIHHEYYIQTNMNTRIKSRLCKQCFFTISDYYKPYSANLWKLQGVYYTLYKNHTVVDAENVLQEIIWEPKNWCDHCIIEPLCYILDYSECRRKYNEEYKYYNTNLWESDSDDSDDNTDLCIVQTVNGNTVTDEVFKTLFDIDARWKAARQQ